MTSRLPLHDARVRHADRRRLLWSAICAALAASWLAWRLADHTNPWTWRSAMALVALVLAGAGLYEARRAERRAARHLATVERGFWLGSPDDG